MSKLTTKKNKPAKPQKPSPDFPLFPHDSGKWAKKIGGKLRYFGRWDDPDGALQLYLQSLEPKKTPQVLGNDSRDNAKAGPMTVAVACERFLAAKRDQVATGSMAARTLADYIRTMNRLADFMGTDRPIESLRPMDFERYQADYSLRNNPVSVGNEVTRIKTMLKWLERTGRTKHIDTGPDFRKPPDRVVRRHKRERGKMLFTAKQIRDILNESGLRMRAMILLGINCGYHNADCESLTTTILREGVYTGWLDNARIKTEVERRCRLWPETIAASRAWLDVRPVTESKLAFVLVDGRPMSPVNCDVAKRFRSVRDAALIGNGGFSWLRKTFATVASASGDQVAVNFIMGHVDPSIPGVYRQEIQDSRLINVSDHVRKWLFDLPDPA